MLDTETKRRIDTARDILVGKVPDPKSQVEQITIALIYKFMDDMDTESEELGGERTFFKGTFEKYAWRTIFDPRLGGHEILVLYSEAIMKMNENPGIPQLFRDIFKNAYLPYRDPETLKSFLKIINEFDYDHSERLGDAFEYLLSVLSSQGDAGQFRTPRHIIDFMVDIMNPKKSDSIIDPACGTAGFLISSYKHIIKINSENYKPAEDKKAFEAENISLNEITINNTKFKGEKLTPDERNQLAQNIRGYDISPDMVRLSLVNMYLHGLHEPHIQEYDTLTSEDNWNEYADVILANPPFMSPKGGIRPHKRFSIQSNRSEVLFVDYMAEHLTTHGRAAIIVPEGIIFQSGNAYKSLRKMLVNDYLVGVISLPAGVFNPYSGVKTSIIWIDKSLAKKTDKIIFVKVENDGFDLGAQRRPIKKNDLPHAAKAIGAYKEALRYGSIYNAEAFQRTSVVEKSKIVENGDYNLSGERYKPLPITKTKFTEVLLGNDDLFAIESGGTPDSQNEGYWNGDINWITLADLPAKNLLTEITDSVRKISLIGLESSSAKLIPINSVIVSTRATIGRIAINKVELATNQGFKNIIIKDLNEVSPKYLALVLTKLISKMKELASGGTFKELSKASFKSLSIPLPPLSIQDEIVAEIESYQKIIDGARQVVENYKPRIEIDPEWEIFTIGESCKLMTGGTPTSTFKEYYENGNIKWLVSGDIHKNEIFDCDGRITELGMQKSNTKILPINSVLIALNGQGKTRGTVALLRTEATCNQSIVSIDPINKEKLLPEYVYLQLKSMYNEIRNITGDQQRSGLNMPIIRSIKLNIPPINIQHKIVDKYYSEKKLIDTNTKIIEVFEKKIKERIGRVWGE